MKTAVTSQSVSQFVEEVSQKRHAMAGAVIALSAGQAAALGQACMQISREALQIDADAISQGIGRVAQIKAELLQWCDRDASAIAEYAALRDAGETLKGQRLLCIAPATVGQLSLEAAIILQEFRPSVSERVRDDLEMSISLLAGTAQAAVLLLDSNLRIWPEPALLQEFDPLIEHMVIGIGRLRPLMRIREKRGQGAGSGALKRGAL